MRAVLLFGLLCTAAGLLVTQLLGVPADGYELVWGLTIAAAVGLALGLCFLVWTLRQKKRREG